MILSRSFYIDTTKGVDILNISHEVRRVVREAKVDQGWVIVMAPWEGAAFTVMENTGKKAEKIKSTLESFLSNGLADCLLSKTQIVPIRGGDLMVDPWQSVYLIDYEAAAKRREYFVQLYGEDKKEGADKKNE